MNAEEWGEFFFILHVAPPPHSNHRLADKVDTYCTRVLTELYNKHEYCRGLPRQKRGAPRDVLGHFSTVAASVLSPVAGPSPVLGVTFASPRDLSLPGESEQPAHK